MKLKMYNCILNEFSIDIGNMFVYKDNIWIRTTLYTATSLDNNLVESFGNLLDYQVMPKIEKINTAKLKDLILNNIDLL